MTTKTQKHQVLGLQEIAEVLGVAKRTPHTWQFRNVLPDPDFESVNGHVAWKRTTILKWAARTGRLDSAPPSVRSEASKWA